MFLRSISGKQVGLPEEKTSGRNAERRWILRALLMTQLAPIRRTPR